MDLSVKIPEVQKKNYPFLTYSSITDFLNCPMKYFFRNVIKIIPVKKSTALTIGGIFHDAIEKYYNITKELDPGVLDTVLDWVLEECKKQDDYLESNDDVIIQGMVYGWVHHYQNSNYKIVENEILFDIPYERGYHRCGKSDAKIINEKGQLYLGEWKTSGQISTYVKKMQVDNQGNNYLWAFEGDEPHGVIFRIAKKSALRLKKSESAMEYRERIFKDYIERPNDNFHEEIVYLDKIGLQRWKHEVSQICEMIEMFTKSEGWYRNTSNCYLYNSLCPYHMICKCTNKTDFESVKKSHYLHCEPGQELFEVKK